MKEIFKTVSGLGHARLHYEVHILFVRQLGWWIS